MSEEGGQGERGRGEVSSVGNMSDFRHGIRKGIPIAIGYLSVSFTFGVKAVHGGIPVWAAVLMSLTNVTSAGQFAGLTLIIAQGGCVELAMTTFIINIRYMLMSFSLSQKVESHLSLGQRLRIGYGITDEIFAVAVAEQGTVSAHFMYGLICIPVLGWTLGTALGALASQIMPEALSRAMELGLYAMFIAIIIPPMKKNKPITAVVAIAVLVTVVLYTAPVLKNISGGFRVIIATVLAASVGAFLFPVKQEGSYD